MEDASLRWPGTFSRGGTSVGIGATGASSSSSSSSEVWHRRHRSLVVRNCTKRQLSQRTTSRESTGDMIVAIQVLGDQSAARCDANVQITRSLREDARDVKKKYG